MKAIEIVKKRIRKLDLHKMGEFEYEAQEFENKQMGIVLQALQEYEELKKKYKTLSEIVEDESFDRSCAYLIKEVLDNE